VNRVLQRAIRLALVFAFGSLGAIGQTDTEFEQVIVAPSDPKWEDNAPQPGQRAVLFGDPHELLDGGCHLRTLEQIRGGGRDQDKAVAIG
jgi:hypothetical protein